MAAESRFGYLLAAVDVERLQPAKIVSLRFDRDDRVLPQPIRPSFLDNLAGVERHRQADPQELHGIGIVARRHRQCVEHLEGTFGVFFGGFELLPPALDRVLRTSEGAQDPAGMSGR